MTRNNNTHPQGKGLLSEFQSSNPQPSSQEQSDRDHNFKYPIHRTTIFTGIYSFLALLLLFPVHAHAKIYSSFISLEDPLTEEFLWEEANCEPFDELSLSWNGHRPPRKSGYAFFVSLYQDGKWSPWLYTAEWGDRGQMLYQESPTGSFAESRRDLIRSKKELCTGFRVQVFSWSPFVDKALKLIISTYNSTEVTSPILLESLESVLLSTPPRISQIGLRHPRYLDLSLPTATAAAVGLLKHGTIDASQFCDSVYDCEFDFYESWVFNAAEASTHLDDYDVYTTRLPNFGALHTCLLQDNPVIVSVKGYLPGCARPYRFDHMVCIYGYDADKKLVYAIDPGFPNDKASATTFPLQEFLQSWTRTGNRACIFNQREP